MKHYCHNKSLVSEITVETAIQTQSEMLEYKEDLNQ